MSHKLSGDREGTAPTVSVRVTKELVAFIERERVRLASMLPAGLASPTTGDAVRTILMQAMRAEGSPVPSAATSSPAAPAPAAPAPAAPAPAPARPTRPAPSTVAVSPDDPVPSQDALRRTLAAFMAEEQHTPNQGRRYSLRVVATAIGVTRSVVDRFLTGVPLGAPAARRLAKYLSS